MRKLVLEAPVETDAAAVPGHHFREEPLQLRLPAAEYRQPDRIALQQWHQDIEQQLETFLRCKPGDDSKQRMRWIVIELQTRHQRLLVDLLAR